MERPISNLRNSLAVGPRNQCRSIDKFRIFDACCSDLTSFYRQTFSTSPWLWNRARYARWKSPVIAKTLRTDAQFSNAMCLGKWKVKRLLVSMCTWLRESSARRKTFRDITKSLPRDKRSCGSINWTSDPLGLDIIWCGRQLWRSEHTFLRALNK